MLLLRSHRRRGLDAVDANGRPADGGAAAFADDVSPVLATIVVRVQLTGRRGILLVHLVFKPIAAPLLKPFTDSPSSSLGRAAVEDNRTVVVLFENSHKQESNHIWRAALSFQNGFFFALQLKRESSRLRIPITYSTQLQVSSYDTQ